MTLGWSEHPLVLDGDAPAVDQLVVLNRGRARWVVVTREARRYHYVFGVGELIDRLRRTSVPFDLASRRSLAEVLELHEWEASRTFPVAKPRAAAIELAQLAAALPTGMRCVALASTGRIVAVGGADVDPDVEAVPVHAPAAAPRRPPRRTPRSGATSAGAAADTIGEPTLDDAADRGGAVLESVPTLRTEPSPRRGRSLRGSTSAPTAGAEAPAPAASAQARPATGTTSGAVDDDEGTTPVRHPSIEPAGGVAPGTPITLVVDLLREASPTTAGGALALGPQAADWSTLDIGVTLVSPSIDFDRSGRGRVTIRRNAASTPARLSGRVLDDVPPGAEIEVHAQFWAGTRYSGAAVRTLTVGAARPGAAAAPAGAPASATVGALRVEPQAEAPDLTVFITLFDKERPGRMHWRMTTEPFDGLPPQLDGSVDLGQDPASEAAARFKEFATLERGRHRESIEGFGEALWDSAPAEFRAVYWALHDHHRRPLTIQFVSDDPYLPWELMRPYRDGETHPPLALRHAVARWIGRWHGYMRNRLCAGRVVAVAPKYKSVAARLSGAEAAAARLVASLGAESVEGTWPSLNELLERPSGAPIGVLYFTGHGVFNGDSAASAIKLQDRAMKVSEVARREVRLGERDGTLVFFNACEVGATGRILGKVGGWADAFLSRRFRAFIAPLWAIDEEDAAQVTDELLARIVRDRVPVGAALRDLRAAHGDVSPTFYSYLLFGDVTARVDAGS